MPVASVTNTGWVRRSLIQRVEAQVPRINEMLGDKVATIELGRAGNKGLSDPFIGKVPRREEFVYVRVVDPQNDRLIGHGSNGNDYTETGIVTAVRTAIQSFDKKSQQAKSKALNLQA